MRILFLFLFCIAVTSLFFSCASRQQEEKEGTVFYFFPKANAYFDEDNNQYFITDKEKGWQAVTDLPPEEKDSLGEKILLTNPPTPVWKNNEQDRLLYSLSTYASAQEYRKKFYEDSLNSLPKKVQKAEEDTVSKKEKTGLGKFLEKVFSKKEKGRKGKDKQPD